MEDPQFLAGGLLIGVWQKQPRCMYLKRHYMRSIYSPQVAFLVVGIPPQSELPLSSHYSSYTFEIIPPHTESLAIYLLFVSELHSTQCGSRMPEAKH